MGAQSAADYAHVAEQAAEVLTGSSRSVMAGLRERLDGLAAQERFEEAATLRDRMMALVRAAARAQRLRPLAEAPELVAARRRDAGGWEIVVVRHGRLAGTTVTPPGADPLPYIDALRETAEVVPPPGSGSGAVLTEETELILRWLETPGVRLVDLQGRWTCPVDGAGASRALLEPAAARWHEIALDEVSLPAPVDRPVGALREGVA